MPDCEHVAIRDDMDMICTHCGIVLSLLDRPKTGLEPRFQTTNHSTGEDQ